MTLTPMQTLAIILAVAAGTQLTRWLPFWLFPENRKPPAAVTYLGRVLPPAMMGLLVVYCLKGVTWLEAPHGAPEIIAVAVVTALHCWKRNVLLSIAGGTAVYMLLVQQIFARISCIILEKTAYTGAADPMVRGSFFAERTGIRCAGGCFGGRLAALPPWRCWGHCCTLPMTGAESGSQRRRFPPSTNRPGNI